MAMCDRCKKRPATVRVSSTVNGQETEQGLCAQCAMEDGFFSNPFMPFAQMMAGMMGESVRPQRCEEGGLTCSHCGYDFSRFKESGLLGCPQCYRDFSDYLTPMVRRIQGSTSHLGVRPGETAPAAVVDTRLKSLQKELGQALEQEEYEKAAKLRDEMRALQGGEKEHGKAVE